MSISVLRAETGWVVMGTDNPTLARAVLVEELLNNEELDNYGVCTEEESDMGMCDLTTDDLCDACKDFLATIFGTRDAVSLPTLYWKEL